MNLKIQFEEINAFMIEIKNLEEQTTDKIYKEMTKMQDSCLNLIENELLS